jgi:predicted phage tail protein
MMRKVYLDGEMAEKFGSEFTVNAKRMADVFRCLECNFPELREYLLECHEKDIGFLCQIGDEGIQDEEELLLSLGEGDVYISPQPAGSKSGIGKILAAIALVVVAIYAPYLYYGGMQGLGAAAGATAAGGIGSVTSLGLALGGTFSLATLGLAVNLALTGLQQIMAPDPSVDTPDTAESSYLFQGAEQTIVEGDPVPVLYGQLRVPGRPIGFEIRNKENTFSSNYGGGTYGGKWWQQSKQFTNIRIF